MKQPPSSIRIPLFLFLFFTFAYFHHTGQHNENARFDQIRSIVEDGRWNIDRYRHNTADATVVDGKTYPNKAPGSTYLGAIVWKLAHLPLKAFGLEAATGYHLLCYLVTIFALGAVSALAACALFSFLSTAGGNSSTALIITLFYALGTIAFPFSTVFFSHQITASFLFLGFYLVWKEGWENTRTDSERSGRGASLRLMLAGFLLGFATVLEYPAALGTIFIGLYGLTVIRPARRLVPFIAGGLGAGSLLLLYNWLAFQRLFYLSYSAYLDNANSAFPGHRKGFLGVGLPTWEAMRETTIGRARGIFYVNPWLLLFIPALLTPLWFPRLRRELILCFAIVFAFFLFNAGFGDSIIYWGGACSVGPRHVIPMLPFMVIPIALFSLHSVTRAVTIFLGVLSVCVMFLAAAVEPRVGYEISDPIWNFFVRNYFLGRYALAETGVFSQQPFMGTMGSFNLASLAGIRGRGEIVPILVVWAVAIPFLLRRSCAGDDAGGRMRSSVLLSLALPALILALAFLPVVYNPLSGPSAGRENGLSGSYARGTFWSHMGVTPPGAEISREQLSFVQLDKQIDFSWLAGEPPLVTPFSVVWTGDIYAPFDGHYVFMLESDDGSALYVNGALVIENWGIHGALRKEGHLDLTKGFHPVLIFYDNVQYGGMIRFSWALPGYASEVVPESYLSTSSLSILAAPAAAGPRR